MSFLYRWRNTWFWIASLTVILPWAAVFWASVAHDLRLGHVQAVADLPGRTDIVVTYASVNSAKERHVIMDPVLEMPRTGDLMLIQITDVHSICPRQQACLQVDEALLVTRGNGPSLNWLSSLQQWNPVVLQFGALLLLALSLLLPQGMLLAASSLLAGALVWFGIELVVGLNVWFGWVSVSWWVPGVLVVVMPWLVMMVMQFWPARYLRSLHSVTAAFLAFAVVPIFTPGDSWWMVIALVVGVAALRFPRMGVAYFFGHFAVAAFDLGGVGVSVMLALMVLMAWRMDLAGAAVSRAHGGASGRIDPGQLLGGV